MSQAGEAVELQGCPDLLVLAQGLHRLLLGGGCPLAGVSVQVARVLVQLWKTMRQQQGHEGV